MHQILKIGPIGVFDGRLRRRRLITMIVLGVISWVLFLAALYLLWIITT